MRSIFIGVAPVPRNGLILNWIDIRELGKSLSDGEIKTLIESKQF